MLVGVGAVVVAVLVGMAFRDSSVPQVSTATGSAAPGATGPSTEVSAAAPAPTVRTPPGQTREGSAPTAAPLQIATDGPGTFRRSTENIAPASVSGRLLRYDVRVERGLPFDSEQTATAIQRVLNDKRSWSGSGDWRFALVSSSRKADVHVYLATPTTTDKLCAPLLTRGDVSCQNGRSVVLNAERWAFGAKAYGKDVQAYRRYLVNHEFGHALGYGHVGCPAKGRRAPVMMQQTKGVGGCRANPWPSPRRS
jgi:ssRNA-specific RNase YbeY (16S rRNA maturation enzyme)